MRWIDFIPEETWRGLEDADRAFLLELQEIIQPSKQKRGRPKKEESKEPLSGGGRR